MSQPAIKDPTLFAGRYRLDVELGAGAFGSVYKATQMVLDRPLRSVALKVFHSEAVSAGNLQQTLNEAIQIISLLSDLSDWEIRQHFVTVFDVGVTDTDAPQGYVSMELVGGGSLAGRLRDLKKFTLHATFDYLLQITRAMAFMHLEGYVHSDLKPDNVLVFRGRERDLLKIGDLGLSGKYLGLFSEGPRGGTVSYMSREALLGSPTTPACDVFAIGLMAYEMLCGNCPYASVGSTLNAGDPDYQTDLNRLQLQSRENSLCLQPGAFVESVMSEAELDVAAILFVINKALACDVSKRYPSAVAMYEDLQRIARGRPPVSDGKGRTAPVAADPYESLAEEVRFHIAAEDWASAGAKASELARLTPERPDAYLLQSQISIHQADKAPVAKLRETLLKQAISKLQRGVRICQQSADRRRLNQAIADIYHTLGDHETARQFRNIAG